MNIILDTNIFRSDIKLGSNNIEIILSYLKKTGSTIVMPKIILEELKSLYTKELKDRIIEYNKTVRKLKILSKNLNIKEIYFSDSQMKIELKNYINFVFEKLDIQKKNIIKYNNQFLPEAINRAINKNKPFNINGKGFQDTIIWLTLKKYCFIQKDKKIIFISENTKDFGSGDGKLDPELDKECNEKGIRVYYYENLFEFVKNHNSKIDFITEEWIYLLLDKEDVSEKISGFLEKEGESIFIDSFENDIGHKFTGFIHIMNIIDIYISEFYIYELDDQNYIVYVSIDVNVEIDFLSEPNNKSIINHRLDFEDTKIYDIDLVVSFKIDAQKRLQKTEVTF